VAGRWVHDGEGRAAAGEGIAEADEGEAGDHEGAAAPLVRQAAARHIEGERDGGPSGRGRTLGPGIAHLNTFQISLRGWGR